MLTWNVVVLLLALSQLVLPADQGRRAVELLLAGKYGELIETFTPEMKQALPEDGLRTRVGDRLRELGQVEEIGEPRVQQLANNVRIVIVPVRFTAMAVNIQVTLNDAGKIAGLFLRPADDAPPKPWQAPAYVNPQIVRAREVIIGDGEWRLPGTLTVPTDSKGKVAGVVLVHGSGPHDRDETVGPNKPFRDLAEGLASRGIAVLRYEKRTREHATRIASRKQLTARDITVKEETIDDAVLATELLRSQPEVDPKRVFLLGHSLGGYLAPRIAARDPNLAGLIILAGNTRPLEDLILEQMDYIQSLQSNVSERQREQLNQLRRQIEELKKTGSAGTDGTIFGLPANYLLDLRGYNPAAEASKLNLPMLILQGERDYQVTMKDFAAWRSALSSRDNVILKSYPSLNHLFMPGQGKSTPAEYRTESHVSADVIEDLARWLTR